MTIASLTRISGIGPQTAKLIFDNGFKDVQSVAGAGVDTLSKIQGFSKIRAEKTIQSAIALLNGTQVSSTKSVQKKKAKPEKESEQKAKKSTSSKAKRKIKKLKAQLVKKGLNKKSKKKLKKKLKKLKKQ